MSEYTPDTEFVRDAYVDGQDDSHNDGKSRELHAARFDGWLAEVERAAAEKALLAVCEKLNAADDGGRRGVSAHSKSAASAGAHRHAVSIVRDAASKLTAKHVSSPQT
ncbi:hypothetical protein [Leucobacter japonicus]|uniref:hypothetical protein n=1 Tax=Leucobacter japonicus TaxID=1461259 RepID=UPI0006A7EDF0|nr:hypothetical protein [Leucobacter japonicus]